LDEVDIMADVLLIQSKACRAIMEETRRNRKIWDREVAPALVMKLSEWLQSPWKRQLNEEPDIWGRSYR